MNQPAKSSFPEYGSAHLTEDARAHLLGAATCWNAGHEAMLRGELKKALVEIDKAIAIGHEARKFLLGQGTLPPTPAAPEEPTLL